MCSLHPVSAAIFSEQMERFQTGPEEEIARIRRERSDPQNKFLQSEIEWVLKNNDLLEKCMSYSRMRLLLDPPSLKE